ncbi:ATP-binding protein [Streptomyces atroolivaceus]|uniref:ATP-binding protein n=1 Tax=Streptomyces atroolivaceus TaxID=66869 RepID=UPI002025AD32|nr:ATP-binding protein [Streptomyces atroolivaceus]
MTSANTTAPSTSPHRQDGENYRLSLPNTARSAGIARHFVASLLTGTPHCGIVDDARLCVTEVVANAHRHTRTSLIRVQVTVGTEQVTVSVADDTPWTAPAAGATSDGMNPTRHAQECGRGLFLLDELALAWGSEVCGCCSPSHKAVWFTLAGGAETTAQQSARPHTPIQA